MPFGSFKGTSTSTVPFGPLRKMRTCGRSKREKTRGIVRSHYGRDNCQFARSIKRLRKSRYCVLQAGFRCVSGSSSRNRALVARSKLEEAPAREEAVARPSLRTVIDINLPTSSGVTVCNSIPHETPSRTSAIASISSLVTVTPRGILAGVEFGPDPEPGLRPGVPDAVDDGLIRRQRGASPVRRDVTEETVLDLVPFGCGSSSSAAQGASASGTARAT